MARALPRGATMSMEFGKLSGFSRFLGMPPMLLSSIVMTDLFDQ
jgi:hypothetical protein